jgi:hypothetical protein
VIRVLQDLAAEMEEQDPPVLPGLWVGQGLAAEMEEQDLPDKLVLVVLVAEMEEQDLPDLPA